MKKKVKYIIPILAIFLLIVAVWIFIILSQNCTIKPCGTGTGVCCIHETIFENPKRYLVVIIPGISSLLLWAYWINLLRKKKLT